MKEINRWMKYLNFTRRHAVSIIMVGITGGFIIWFPHIAPSNQPHLFFTLPLLFMIRGVYWEEMYRKLIVAQQEEIELLKDSNFKQK